MFPQVANKPEEEQPSQPPPTQRRVSQAQQHNQTNYSTKTTTECLQLVTNQDRNEAHNTMGMMVTGSFCYRWMCVYPLKRPSFDCPILGLIGKVKSMHTLRFFMMCKKRGAQRVLWLSSKDDVGVGKPHF